MPKLVIDFGAPPQRGSPAGWWILAVAVVCAGATAVAYYRVMQESTAIEARLDALSIRAGKSFSPASPDPAKVLQLRKRAEMAGRIVDALEQPWIRLLDDVESAGVRGISLLSLEPDADKLVVRLAGEAVDRDTLSRYLERLGEATSLREVRLAQHEWQQRGTANSLRFVVSARWSRSR